MTNTLMANSSIHIRMRDPNLAPLFRWGISAGLVCMEALLTVGGTMDTLAAWEAAMLLLCGWSLCLGPVVVEGAVVGAVELALSAAGEGVGGACEE